jgi:hypothetical protein
MPWTHKQRERLARWISAKAGGCRSRPGFAAAALLIACSSAGCGSSTPSLDTAPVARAIAHSILVQRDIRTTVRCPPRVPRKAGVKFTCTAALDVGSYPVSATETNGDGRVRYGNPAPLVTLDVAEVQNAIAKSILAERHLRATVSCPAEVIQQAGVTFACTAAVDAARYPFVVTETNGAGHVSYVGQPRITAPG